MGGPWKIAERWRDELARAGGDAEMSVASIGDALGSGLALVLQVHLADTQEQAIREAGIWFEEQLKVLAPLGRMADADGGAKSRPRTTERQRRRPACRRCAIWCARGLGSAGRPNTWPPGSPKSKRNCPAWSAVTIGAGALGIPPEAIRQNHRVVLAATCCHNSRRHRENQSDQGRPARGSDRGDNVENQSESSTRS